MKAPLDIRSVSATEFQTAIDWAANEGWNPGLDDLQAFYATDPHGFLMGFIGETPVSSISVVRYGNDFGFLGFYIVHPDHRGTGVGIATWNAGIKHLAGRTIGLDGVVDQQENYQKSGFVYAGRNVRYSGIPKLTAGLPTETKIRNIDEGDAPALCLYDQQYFPANRDAFIQSWAHPDRQIKRRAKVALKSGAITGYGVIRACQSGFKIGPLFVDNKQTAVSLIYELCVGLAADDQVTLDTPEDNPAATEIANALGLEPVFETARMYKGAAPALDLDRVFGITSFELG